MARRIRSRRRCRCRWKLRSRLGPANRTGACGAIPSAIWAKRDVDGSPPVSRRAPFSGGGILLELTLERKSLADCHKRRTQHPLPHDFIVQTILDADKPVVAIST